MIWNEHVLWIAQVVSSLRESTQHPLNHTVTRLQGFRKFFGLISAAFGHVGLAAASATDDGREFFNDLAGRNALREIVGRADDQRSLAVIAAAEHDHA